ncbi:endonuclease/exonuclease/phosphatase family protein [Litoribacter ruber]|uniref:endonuclease/exonuclease/phosphatase family protein n=1 Tax=Litoribacter ruber TaxID=702568 RepID=UPI001BD9D1BF|nr:endonuclease/exonuclease/phosphatase family protein [Litoribacter ruber]MBT0811338.1 endonuclease/exonuclease/phosphatase family protein [Litoribacter ruber]
MRIVTYILIFVAVITTALPLIQTTHWWIRIFDYPRAQIAVIAILAQALTFVYFRHDMVKFLGISVFLLAAIAYQGRLMIKYTPIYPVQAPGAFEPVEENTFSILMYNVRLTNDRYADFLNLARERDPDIILLTEPDQAWADAVEGLDQDYPHHIKHPLDNTYGMILYSRLGLEDTELNFLVKDSIPSIFTKVKLPSGVLVNLHCLHPEPPKPGTPTYERDTEILIISDRVIQDESPTVIAGDLNDVAWSRTSELFQKRTYMLDPREGRGLFSTYNTFVPLFRYPLDHFFYSKHFNLVNFERLPHIGSDHFPIKMTVEYVPLEERFDKSK